MTQPASPDGPEASVRYPDWICVGAQKAATTWLYQQFTGVPGMFLPAIKELHYYSELCDERVARYSVRQRERKTTATRAYWQKLKFAVADRKQRRERRLAELEHLRLGTMTDEWYGGIFAFAPEGDVCGEICPSYMSMPQEGLDHVFRLNPDSKILVVVRDPVARCWSHLRMVHDQDKLLELNDAPNLEKRLGIFFEYTDYAASIPRWQASAADGNCRVILFDDVKSRPNEVLDDLCDFVGHTGPRRWPRAEEASHKGTPFPMPERIRSVLLDVLAPQYDYLARDYPEQVEAWRAKHDPARTATTAG
jgi:hypothetical protein